MEQVVEGARFEEFGDYCQSWRHTADSNQKHNAGMPVLRQHVDLVAEFLQKLIGDLGIECLLDGNFESLVSAAVDGAEASHGDLFVESHVIEIDFEDEVRVEVEGFLAGSFLLEAHFLQLLFQLFHFLLLIFILVLHLNDPSESFAVV